MSKKHYQVGWSGIREGYEITLTSDAPNDYDVFEKFSDAKRDAVEKAKSDVEGARVGLQATKRITKGDVR